MAPGDAVECCPGDVDYLLSGGSGIDRGQAGGQRQSLLDMTLTAGGQCPTWLFSTLLVAVVLGGMQTTRHGLLQLTAVLFCGIWCKVCVLSPRPCAVALLRRAGRLMPRSARRLVRRSAVCGLTVLLGQRAALLVCGGAGVAKRGNRAVLTVRSSQRHSLRHGRGRQLSNTVSVEVSTPAQTTRFSLLFGCHSRCVCAFFSPSLTHSWAQCLCLQYRTSTPQPCRFGAVQVLRLFVCVHLSVVSCHMQVALVMLLRHVFEVWSGLVRACSMWNVFAQTNPLFVSLYFVDDLTTDTTLRWIRPPSAPVDIAGFITVLSVYVLMSMFIMFCNIVLFIRFLYVPVFTCTLFENNWHRRGCLKLSMNQKCGILNGGPQNTVDDLLYGPPPCTVHVQHTPHIYTAIWPSYGCACFHLRLSTACLSPNHYCMLCVMSQILVQCPICPANSMGVVVLENHTDSLFMLGLAYSARTELHIGFRYGWSELILLLASTRITMESLARVDCTYVKRSRTALTWSVSPRRGHCVACTLCWWTVSVSCLLQVLGQALPLVTDVEVQGVSIGVVW